MGMLALRGPGLRGYYGVVGEVTGEDNHARVGAKHIAQDLASLAS